MRCVAEPQGGGRYVEELIVGLVSKSFIKISQGPFSLWSL
jgi:hypothetical protein